MSKKITEYLSQELTNIKESGMYKTERVLASSQDAQIKLTDGSEVINFCANNYLGLSNNPEIIKAAQAAMDKWGFGLSSVRFICGTQELHKQLEAEVSEYLGRRFRKSSIWG